MNQGSYRRGHQGSGFDDVVVSFRRELLVHCYRMLGSMEDAEDAVQDAILRALKAASGFEGRSTPRTWLYRIATNVCLTRLARRSARVLPVDLGTAGDSDPVSPWPRLEGAFVGPFPDALIRTQETDPGVAYEARESIELAFTVALQHLPAGQRAVLVLRDVLGFSAKEAAATLEVSVASVTSALQRARKTIRQHLPDVSQQETIRALGDDRVRELADRYVDAWERGDVDDIMSLLTDDVVFSMPPHPIWFSGRRAVAEFLPAGPLQVSWQLREVGVNGHLAFGCYSLDTAEGGYVAHSLDVITLRGDRIAAIVTFLDQDSDDFARFGLPAALP